MACGRVSGPLDILPLRLRRIKQKWIAQLRKKLAATVDLNTAPGGVVVVVYLSLYDGSICSEGIV